MFASQNIKSHDILFLYFYLFIFHMQKYTGETKVRPKIYEFTRKYEIIIMEKQQ